MKVKFCLSSDGIKRIAEGQVPAYSWDFATVTGEGAVPSTCMLLCEFEVSLPTRDQCVPLAVEKLKKEIADVQAEAFQRVQEMNVTLSNLLSIAHDPAPDVVGPGYMPPADKVVDFTNIVDDPEDDDFLHSGDYMCIKTGCYMEDPLKDRHMWGDLHVNISGDDTKPKFIFNGAQSGWHDGALGGEAYILFVTEYHEMVSNRGRALYCFASCSPTLELQKYVAQSVDVTWGV